MSRSYTRQKRELNSYIDSLGVVLPKDYHDHVRGGVNEDDCLFCAAPHNEIYKIYTFSPIEAIRKDFIQAYACSDCGLHVDAMIQQQYDPKWMQISNMDKNGDSSSSYERSSERYNRVKAALKEGKYLNDVHLYYTRHSSSTDKFIEHQTHMKCYACSEFLGREDDEHQLVPVTPSFHILGGVIRYCNICAPSLRQYFSNVPGLLTQKCARCEITYLIDSEEFNDRQKRRLLNKLNCPTCAYLIMDSGKYDDTLVPDENKAPRKALMVRYAEKVCSLCKREFAIDLTSPLGESVTLHLSHNKFVPILCTKCSRYNAFLSSHPTTVALTPKWLLHYNFDETTFALYFAEKGGLVLKLRRKYEGKKVSSFILFAQEEAEKFIFGKQGELWSEKS